MKINDNQAMWPEEVLKCVINSYPELSEYDGSVKIIESDENNAVFMVVYKNLNLSLLVIIKNKEILPIDCGIKENEIVHINKENKDIVFADFNNSSGMSDVNSSRGVYSDDPEMIHNGIKEIRDADGNFLGYSSNSVNWAVPGSGVDIDSMYGGLFQPGVYGYGSFLNKYAKMNRIEKEEIIS